ncbi:polyprenol phosphomannose-dependent alpha 1,6 mannosyltransferase MptB [Actinoplanes sp. TBRC 11911]|uniref:polyprenol phosphomannose-dependent alpha 1,6 mannosyltransferase MptB n=1 Tax=Actinoplanes sp. TBRC 11911 TaxID=2729386 RepID=UPI00145E1ABB|nr:polyprenol phosphomannose-dependent alpha 1,6 mannosyltransferase MptB [Actinoplanes sp. TBRC 11911]NMO53026.1 polyprenol phosphomannose-dependent alpha 1,6 mannosyltransferase MptB [Actinoplanes sp. TBRC 11911]
MSRATLCRYAGLAGSLLLAVAAWLGGARSPWQPTVTPRTIFAGENGVVLPLSWLLGTLLMIGAWWFGRRAVPSARWAYVTAALWAVPLLPFLPLGSYDVYSYACQGWQQSAGLDPYAGGVAGCPWHEAVAPTWLNSPAPYGPVFLVLAAAAAKLGGSLTGTIILLRVIAVLGVLLIAVCLPVLARRAGVPLKRAVWLTLACPLVPIHLVSGAHNDAVMVGFLVAALALASTKRYFWAAGILLGLAIGVKATAVVVVPFVLLLARPRWLRGAVEIVGSAAATIVVISLASGRGLGWITGLTGSSISVQWTSPSTAVGMAIDQFGPDAVPVTRVVGIVVLVVVLALLWWRSITIKTADPITYAGYALAATVLLSPVFHPWYATWALPVLAATLRRDTRWLLVPCAIASALCLPDGYNLALATKAQGALAVTAFLLIFAGKAIYEAKNRAGPDRRRARGDRDPERLPY